MKLSGKKIVILVEQDYQDLEVWYPLLRLREEGAEVIPVGTGSAKSYKGKYGYPVEAKTTIDQVEAKSLDAVIIPGGWAPDFLRRYPTVNALVRDAFQQNKTVAAICHAGWVLVSAGILKGKTVTCFSAIKDDVVNAGAKFVDQDVVVDGHLITSRTPDDLPAFCSAIINQLSQVPAHA